jgi:hypothetical protein
MAQLARRRSRKPSRAAGALWQVILASRPPGVQARPAVAAPVSRGLPASYPAAAWDSVARLHDVLGPAEKRQISDTQRGGRRGSVPAGPGPASPRQSWPDTRGRPALAARDRPPRSPGHNCRPVSQTGSRREKNYLAGSASRAARSASENDAGNTRCRYQAVRRSIPDWPPLS